MFDIGGSEAFIIVMAILLLFGAKRIPDLARSMGSGIREFRKAMREISDEVTTSVSVDPTPRTRIVPPAPSLKAPEEVVSQLPQLTAPEGAPPSPSQG